jgi:hypothetical protein
VGRRAHRRSRSHGRQNRGRCARQRHFGGAKGVNSYNTSLFEQFIDYNFGQGWFAYSDPNIVANWQANGTKWTVPLGGGAGRIIRLDKLPIRLEAGVFYGAVQPTSGGRWLLNAELTLIF